MRSGRTSTFPGAPFCTRSELYSAHEFNHPAGIGSLRISEVLVVDVGTGIRIAVADRLQLQDIERIEHVHLKTQHGMVFTKVMRELLGQTEA